MKLLVEYQTKPCHVTREKNFLYLEGMMLSSKPNKNGRVYPQRVLEESVEAVQERIKNGSFYGGISHDQNDAVSLDRASHIVTSLTPRGDGFYGRARVLTGTPAGNILESIAVHHNAKIGFSSRGYGVARQVGKLHEIQSPFTLSAIDTVSAPSGKGCWASVIHEGIKTKQYSLCEQQLGYQILREMEGPKGNSLANYPLAKHDVGPYGYKWSDPSVFSRDSATFPDQMMMDTNEILHKLAALQSQPDFQQQDWQDAAKMRAYIAQIDDPLLRQKLYNALADAIGFHKMRARANDLLGRIGKYNR
jgi:hypothetical protein